MRATHREEDGSVRHSMQACYRDSEVRHLMGLYVRSQGLHHGSPQNTFGRKRLVAGCVWDLS